MNKYEKAIKYFEEHMKVLDNHCKHGGDFALEAREHTQTAIEALRKQVPRAALAGKCPACGEFVDREYDYCDCGQALNWQATDCIQITCEYCCYSDNKNIVCPRYADKVDEIRRIYEEGGND